MHTLRTTDIGGCDGCPNNRNEDVGTFDARTTPDNEGNTVMNDLKGYQWTAKRYRGDGSCDGNLICAALRARGEWKNLTASSVPHEISYTEGVV